MVKAKLNFLFCYYSDISFSDVIFQALHVSKLTSALTVDTFKLLSDFFPYWCKKKVLFHL